MVATSVPVRKEGELLLAYMSGKDKHMLPEETASKGTSSWGFECACVVCERLGGRARECGAARKLLGESVLSQDEPEKWAERLGKVRALALLVPDGGESAGESQPHLASLLNLAAKDAMMNDQDSNAAKLRKAIALLRESIEICPPEGSASRHLVSYMGGYQTHRMLSLCLEVLTLPKLMLVLNRLRLALFRPSVDKRCEDRSAPCSLGLTSGS